MCKLKKPIYRLKQASKQQCLEFDEMITFLEFKENIANECVYYLKDASRFVILILYVDDILLTSNDVSLLNETKQMLSQHFEMKDLSNTSFVLDIQIHHDKSQGILGLSQKSYIEKVLKKFNMTSCSLNVTFIQRG